MRLLGDVGFEAIQMVPLEHSEVPEGSVEVFVARRPARRSPALAIDVDHDIARLLARST